ncbi:MAG TPA: hypothetical protein VEL76_40130 [Gemmataceae bacterium]|nr:hypothetical protein [Gemmataceae bacterium]
MAKRRRKNTLPIKDFVAIVADGAIAGQVVEGANVPLVILDTTKRPDIVEAIRVHAHLPPGDVAFRWGGIKGHPDDVLLVLDFQRPIETRAVLRFSIANQGILVEAALTAKGIYLQAGKPGDRLKHDPYRPKMFVELPDTGFRPKWDELFVSRMTAVIRTEHRLPQREAEPLARKLIEQLRTITTFRMPRR